MAGLVYYSSGSGNTARFVAALGLPGQPIPIRKDHPVPVPEAPYVLICPTYADGEGRGAVPGQVPLSNDVPSWPTLRPAERELTMLDTIHSGLGAPPP